MKSLTSGFARLTSLLAGLSVSGTCPLTQALTQCQELNLTLLTLCKDIVKEE